MDKFNLKEFQAGFNCEIGENMQKIYWVVTVAVPSVKLMLVREEENHSYYYL